MAEAVLEFRNVSKRFNQVSAADQVSFSIVAGEVFTLLGPSGCGKTTTCVWLRVGSLTTANSD